MDRNDSSRDPLRGNPPGGDSPGGDLLRERLAAEAARHRPDRDAMLRRIEQGQQATVAPLGRARFRAAGIIVAITAALGLSVVGTWAAVGHYSAPAPVRPGPSVAASSQVGTATSTPAPGSGPVHGGAPGSASPSATASASASASAGATTSTPSPSGTASAPTPATRVQQGFLWSDGSIDPHSLDSWSQSDVTLKNHLTVTALSVELRVAATPGLADTGTWSTVPAADLVTTVTSENGALVYRFTLKPGVTLAPGSYEFAGQYNHAPGGRDAGADSYRATATARGTGVEVFGNFAPVR